MKKTILILCTAFAVFAGTVTAQESKSTKKTVGNSDQKKRSRLSFKKDREEVLEEIKEKSKLYSDAKAIKKASKILTAKFNNYDRKVNYTQILKALSVVDPEVRFAYSDLQSGKYKKVVDRLAADLPKVPNSYRVAAMYLILGDAYFKLGKKWKADKCYRLVLLRSLPRLIFSSRASVKLAELYHSMKRNEYALEMYKYLLNDFNGALTDEEVLHYQKLVEVLDPIYKEPMKSLVDMMGELSGELKQKQLTDKAMKTKSDILDLLTDMIKTAEEKNKPDPEQQRDERDEGEEDEGEEKEKKEQTVKQIRGSAKGGTAGDKKRPRRDADAAKALRPDEAKKVDRWAELSPMEKEKLQNALKNSASDRRRNQINDYHKAMSKDRGKK